MVRLDRTTFLRFDETLFHSWDRDLAPGAGIERPADRSTGRPVHVPHIGRAAQLHPVTDTHQTGRRDPGRPIDCCPVWADPAVRLSAAIV